MNYAIIGSGCFGLYCAMYILQYDNTANITIYDKNISLSSTINGGNGMFHKPFIPKANINIFNLVSIREKNMYKSPIYIESLNLSWAFFSMFNGLFNNTHNRQLISDISAKSNNYCEDGSDYHSMDYWTNLIDELKNKNVKFIEKYINDYKTINNNIIIDNISYDKLIIATNINTNLIKNNHNLFECVSGLSIYIKVKNMPKCFYYNDFMFVTPHDIANNIVNITTHIEVGYNKGNYNITDMDERNNIINYLKNNSEINKLELIEVGRIWRGTRAITYDMLPFFTEINKNIYWITGGSFLGTNSSKAHCKWLVEYINNLQYSDLPKNYDPTINRLYCIKKKYIMNLIILFSILIILIILVKNKFYL